MKEKQGKKPKLTRSHKKNFLFKSFGWGTILLTAFSVFSTGFSSWVIVHEGQERITGVIEVEKTLNVAEFIRIIEIKNRDFIEITPYGFILNETLEDDTYLFEFDIPFSFELDYKKLAPFLENKTTVSLNVILKHKRVGNFGLFQAPYMRDEQVGVSLNTIVENLSASQNGFVNTYSFSSFRTQITFTPPEPTTNNEKIQFDLEYHFDFSQFESTYLYNQFPEENPFNFALEVGILL